VGTFEVRLKKANGQTISRHYRDLKSHEQAAARANKLGIGRIMSVRKVHASDVIGTVKSMGLEDIIGVRPRSFANTGVVFDNTTLGEIVFGKKKAKREERRWNSEKKERVSE
jgi:hypothetical protein